MSAVPRQIPTNLREAAVEIQRRLDNARIAKTRTGRWRAILDADFEYTDVLPLRIETCLWLRNVDEVVSLATFLASSECTLPGIVYDPGVGLDPINTGQPQNPQELMQYLRCFQAMNSQLRIFQRRPDPFLEMILALGIRMSPSIRSLEMYECPIHDTKNTTFARICDRPLMTLQGQLSATTFLPSGVRMLTLNQGTWSHRIENSSEEDWGVRRRPAPRMAIELPLVFPQVRHLRVIEGAVPRPEVFPNRVPRSHSNVWRKFAMSRFQI